MCFKGCFGYADGSKGSVSHPWPWTDIRTVFEESNQKALLDAKKSRNFVKSTKGLSVQYKVCQNTDHTRGCCNEVTIDQFPADRYLQLLPDLNFLQSKLDEKFPSQNEKFYLRRLRAWDGEETESGNKAILDWKWLNVLRNSCLVL